MGKQRVLHGDFLHFFIARQHRLFGGGEDAIEAADHCHRQNDLAVFMGFVNPGQLVRNRPDQVGFLLNVGRKAHDQAPFMMAF